MLFKRSLFFLAPFTLCLLGCATSPAPVANSATGANGTPAAESAPPPPEASSANAAPANSVEPATEPARPVPVRIPAGTVLRVRLAQSLDTSRDGAGERFEATLASPLSENGRVVLPRNTTFTGHIASAKASGRLKGRGYMTLKLDSFELGGARHRVSTSSVTRVTGDHKRRNIALIGGGSGLGALIGGLAGGGKGALIGAGAGAAAGTGGAAATGKKNVHIPAETVMSFRLKAPVEF